MKKVSGLISWTGWSKDDWKEFLKELFENSLLAIIVLLAIVIFLLI